MVFLSCLPTEVITRALGYLSSKELASCTSLSKLFLTIIKASSILTYALELGKAELNDMYHLNLDQFDKSSSELLAALRRREQAWSTFAWTKQWDVPVKRVYKSSEICGPVFVGGYSRRGPGIDTIDVYDFYDINTNGFQTKTRSRCYKLQLCKLSTGLEYDHIEIPQSTISLETFSAGSWESSRSSVQIFGYNLLDVTLGEFNDVRIINWKTAQHVMLFSGVSDSDWTMISETEVLVAGYGENVPLLKYYTVNGFGPNSDKLEENSPSLGADESDTSISGVDQVIFGLPFKKDPHGIAIQTWGVDSISSEVSFTPKPYSPFVKSTTFVILRGLRLLG
ncbi:hypothetical protein Clacol_004439 [Clathrus columnatus]|uniref:F-box domain-containing protein n=1 Tax=Clathrus columnatus TaxID=1419009 RepID=A0AAV5AC47_9AGAM|nr:hypothetical protein Clacol_004439 [Clathrus columnatus]